MVHSIIKYLKSSNDVKYLALPIRYHEIIYLHKLIRTMLSPTLYARCLRRKNARDGFRKFHITIINPKEIPAISEDTTKRFLNRRISYEISGIGYARKVLMRNFIRNLPVTNHLFYATINSPAIEKIRHDLNLSKTDLHITLGFSHSDIHNTRKNNPNFIKFQKRE